VLSIKEKHRNSIFLLHTTQTCTLSSWPAPASFLLSRPSPRLGYTVSFCSISPISRPAEGRPSIDFTAVPPRLAPSAYPAVPTLFPPHDMPALPTRLPPSITGSPPRHAPLPMICPPSRHTPLLMICPPSRHALRPNYLPFVSPRSSLSDVPAVPPSSVPSMAVPPFLHAPFPTLCPPSRHAPLLIILQSSRHAPPPMIRQPSRYACPPDGFPAVKSRRPRCPPRTPYNFNAIVARPLAYTGRKQSSTRQ